VPFAGHLPPVRGRFGTLGRGLKVPSNDRAIGVGYRPGSAGPSLALGANQLNRIVRATIVATLASVLSITGVPRANAAPVPKVALIVGPVGTDCFFRDAANACRVATAATPRSWGHPATCRRWSATDALIAVYIGHGNGFPAVRRLFRPPKFWLNPSRAWMAPISTGEASVEA
jgi:hypothetical protein